MLVNIAVSLNFNLTAVLWQFWQSAGLINWKNDDYWRTKLLGTGNVGDLHACNTEGFIPDELNKTFISTLNYRKTYGN